MMMKLLHCHELEQMKKEKRPKVPCCQLVAMTSTNDRIILDIDTIPEAAKIKKVHALMQLHVHNAKTKKSSRIT